MPAATVAEYLKQLPEDRRAACTRLRRTIKANLPKGFRETIGYGMPAYVVPKSIYPDGYHCDPALPLPFLSFASQKGHVGFYHMGIYADPKLLKWFTGEWSKRVDAKLDMGKSCIRLKKVDAIPYELLGELCTKMTPEDWIALYERQVRR